MTGQGSTHGNDTTITLPLLLLPAPPPQEEVLCPITHEPIGSETYTLPPGFLGAAQAPSVHGEPPKQTTSLLTHPKYAHLLCMELMDCKHRFDARALVAHFLHNGLTCPMCRRGDANAVFDARATFKGFAVSNWVLHHPKLRAAKRRRLVASDIMAALLLFDALVEQQQEENEEEEQDAERLLLRLAVPAPSSSVPPGTTTSSAGRSRVQFRVRVWGSSMSEVYDEAEQQRPVHNSVIVFD